jgi:two-component system response regulator HydG
MVHLPAVGDAAGVRQLLQKVAASRRPCAPLVLVNQRREDEGAAFLRAGAADYLELPGEQDRLSRLVGALTGQLRPGARLGVAANAVSATDAGEALGVMMGQVKRVAPQDITLLLTGETGTGKTRLARLIHELSPRRDKPFLVVDCGSLSPALIESELFGHAKGAFTGADRDRAGKLAAAAEGTLLLDEINSLPLPLQSKLLRAVDSRVFEPVGSNRQQSLRARLIAAANVSLEDEVAAGRFRSDLFYRLNVVGFFLPPLRERRSVIPNLARRFLEQFASRNQTAVHGYSPASLLALRRYDWPGNIRELRNVVERAVALCEGAEVTLDDLPEALVGGQSERPVLEGPAEDCPQDSSSFPCGEDQAGEDSPQEPACFTLHQTRRDVEIRRIREALRNNNNNRLRAAFELGISRFGLYKKLHQYGLMNLGTTELAEP